MIYMWFTGKKLLWSGSIFTTVTTIYVNLVLSIKNSIEQLISLRDRSNKVSNTKFFNQEKCTNNLSFITVYND
jgi:hypothetical protein